MNMITLKDIQKSYGTHQVLKDVNLNIHQGELEHTANRFGIIDGGRVLKEITHDDLKMKNNKIEISPVVLIFIFMQRYIVSGLTNGAVKA